MDEQVIERFPELANGDAWLTHRGRFLDVSLMLQVGEDPEGFLSYLRPVLAAIEQGQRA